MSLKEKDDKALFRMIMNNYIHMESSIVEQLHMQVEHSTTLGTNRETIWKNLFTQIVPRKFSVEQSVFIIDSYGRVSNEIDLAIFDEQYTPYIFKYGTLKFLPVEAVVCVVECKSTSLDKTKLLNWCKKIEELKTVVNSITRIVSGVAINGGTEGERLAQTATRPIRILCHISKGEVADDIKTAFDFIIRTKEKKLEIITANKKRMDEWYKTLNHANFKDGVPNKFQMHPYPTREDNLERADFYNPAMDTYKVSYTRGGERQENTILTLIFQLNQLLMLINNPMPFPHRAYVERFNKIGNELEA